MRKRKRVIVRRTNPLNPMRFDQTRLTTVRRGMSTLVTKTFAQLKDIITRFVVQGDAFGLTRQIMPSSPFDQYPTHTNSFQFETSSRKLAGFRRWIKTQLDTTITSQGDQDLWKSYIEQGYMKGYSRAYDDTNKRGKVQTIPAPSTQTPFMFGDARGTASISFSGAISGKSSYDAAKEQFVRQGFQDQTTVEKVKLLAGRTFSELEDVTSRMATKMSRHLADGLVQGKTPEQIASDMNDEVDIGRNRALSIVQTELTRAHAEGQLDALESMGYAEVTAAVEWTTSALSTVCEKCEPMEGVVLKIAEARGMIPRHPRCQCAWTPIGEETGQDKVTSKYRIDKAIKQSREDDSSGWGPGRKIAKKRPII